MRKALILGNLLKAMAFFILAIPPTSQIFRQTMAYIALVLPVHAHHGDVQRLPDRAALPQEGCPQA